MIATILSGWGLPLGLLLVWLAVGFGVGWRLDRAGHPAVTALSAVVAWPALLPLVGAAPRPTGAGPFARRIEVVFRGLRETLREPLAGGPDWASDLGSLEASLCDADRRIALVDGLLADVAETSEASERLVAARARTAAEVEGVLQGVVELRLQVGMLALAGDDVSIRERLAELMARATAVSEVELGYGTATRGTA